MANTVQIVITVDNAQATAALGATTQALSQAGIQGQTSMTQLAAGTQTATAGLQQAGAAAQQMGGHVTTSLDSVRLLSQEFGLRLPRALEAMLSRMPAVTSAIQGLMGAVASIAIAEVLYRAGEAVYNLYEKYISLSSAAADYNKEVQKHRDEDFVNPHSIEETTTRLNEATEAAKNFKTVGEEMHNGAWGEILAGLSGNAPSLAKGVTDLLNARGMVDQGYKSQSESDSLRLKRLDDEHRLADLGIQEAHAGDESLRGYQKINAELQKKLQISQEQRKYDQQRDSILQGRGVVKGGSTEQSVQDTIDTREAAAQRINLQREITDRTIQLQNGATNAGLQGGALLLQQKLEAENTIRRSATATQAQIDAVELKYHNESMRRIQEETDAVSKRAEAEADANFTGLAKIQVAGGRRVADINQREQRGLYADQTGPNTTSNLAAKDRATAEAETLRQMADADKQYREQQAAEDQRSQAEQLTGFAKIDAQVQESTQRRADEFQKMYGQMDQSSATYLQAQAQLEASKAIITQAGDRERAQLEQQIRQQTLQADTEAAQAERRVRSSGIAGWVQDYQAGLAEIQAAEKAQLAKITEEQGKPGTTGAAFDLYEQQKVDVRVAKKRLRLHSG